MHYSMPTVVVVKHEAVQLVAVMKFEELAMDVGGMLQSEYQFWLPVIRNDFVCL